MTWLPRNLSLRLALMFALASGLLTGAIGFFLYQSLQREVSWRDDQALLGRLERMQALIHDSESIEALQARPQLYENMLGNRDNVLWMVDDTGRVLIDVNPQAMPVPALPPAPSARLDDSPLDPSLRLAWLDVPGAEQGLRLIAGKLTDERAQMLGAYRAKLWIALSVGAVLAFLLGWLVSLHGLRPVRALATRAASIDARHLHVRLHEFEQVSELRALSRAFNQMLARLEQGFAQLSRFSEDLAHEMRTPLSNLMGQTQQALGRDRSVEEYQELLVSNQEEYERLARMIDSMLFLARSEHPDVSINREPVDLQGLVEQLAEYFEGTAQDRGIELVDRCAGTVHADPQLLRRALANLLANALRHAHPDSAVTITSTIDAGNCRISVHNHGEPIAARHLPHLFERFYRCDPSRHEPGDSGGLGLAIVRSIMHAHGGEVDVHSDESGTVFTLSLGADEAVSAGQPPSTSVRLDQ
jgi:two-component system heavy metal sensor histidine kinase CusS